MTLLFLNSTLKCSFKCLPSSNSFPKLRHLVCHVKTTQSMVQVHKEGIDCVERRVLHVHAQHHPQRPLIHNFCSNKKNNNNRTNEKVSKTHPSTTTIMTMLPIPSASPHFAGTSMKRSLSLLTKESASSSVDDQAAPPTKRPCVRLNSDESFSRLETRTLVVILSDNIKRVCSRCLLPFPFCPTTDPFRCDQDTCQLLPCPRCQSNGRIVRLVYVGRQPLGQEELQSTQRVLGQGTLFGRTLSA